MKKCIDCKKEILEVSMNGNKICQKHYDRSGSKNPFYKNGKPINIM